MITNLPLVSVILPVFNSEKYLAESIRSILQQSFQDFELLIINDGSTDKSEQVVKSFTDSRIRYVFQSNIGLANTLNKGISLSQGKYIARQDNDDVSHPQRLHRQISFLEKNPEYALVGSSAAIIDEEGKPTGRKHIHPTKSTYLQLDLVFDNPFVHSSVVFNKERIRQCGGYNSSSEFFEDHNLWSRVSYHFKVANLPDELLLYREVQSGMSKSAQSYSEKVMRQCNLNLNHYFTSRFDNQSLSRTYHHFTNSKIENKQLASCVKELIEIIFNGETEKEKKLALFRFVLKMKMTQVRYQLSNPNLSRIQKLVLKIKRRLIFNRYNNLILSHNF